jgi:hypothetical protein
MCGGEGVRTDERWDAGDGVGGEKPGRRARAWRSLDVDQYGDVEPAERGQHDMIIEEVCRDVRSGEVWRWGDPRDQPPPVNPVRRVGEYE